MDAESDAIPSFEAVPCSSVHLTAFQRARCIVPHPYLGIPILHAVEPSGPRSPAHLLARLRATKNSRPAANLAHNGAGIAHDRPLPRGESPIRARTTYTPCRPGKTEDASYRVTPTSKLYPKPLLVPPRFLLKRMDAFACMRSPGEKCVSYNKNPHITGMLEQLLEEYEANIVDNDQFRAKNAKLAVRFFTMLPQRISNVADFDKLMESLPVNAAKMSGIGKSTCAKIRELLTVGTVSKLEGRLDNDVHKACKDLVSVFGIGPTKARMLAQPPHCVRSVEDLIQRVRAGRHTALTYRGKQIVDSDTLLCLPYNADLQQRIPRSEVEEIIDCVRNAAEMAYGRDTVDLVCCGSYRRGKLTSGDVDILISPKDGATSSDSTCLPVKQLVAELARRGHIIGQLRADSDLDFHHPTRRKARTQVSAAHPTVSYSSIRDKSIRTAISHAERNAGDMPDYIPEYYTASWMVKKEYPHEMFMGLLSLGEGRMVRRLDIKSYPRAVLPFATLYFTGSDFFNRSMRLYVNKCGWTLSDQGLRPAIRERKEKVWDGLSIVCRTEADIFDAVGIPYRKPEDRDLQEEASPADAAHDAAPHEPIELGVEDLELLYSEDE